jgi:hypothetical protein
LQRKLDPYNKKKVEVIKPFYIGIGSEKVPYQEEAERLLIEKRKKKEEFEQNELRKEQEFKEYKRK